MAMSAQSWLQPHLVAVLQNRLDVIRGWRRQANLQGRVKNLENWILVELNHELVRSGFARVVLTNGFFKDGQDVMGAKRVRAADVRALQGRKSKVTYVSADLSVRPASNPDPAAYLIAELKTGMAAGELLDDLRLLRHYRDQRIATSAELGWVVILPDDLERRTSCKRTVDNICRRLHDEPGGCDLMTTVIEDWLIAHVAIPTHTPPNPALRPTGAVDS